MKVPTALLIAGALALGACGGGDQKANGTAAGDSAQTNPTGDAPRSAAAQNQAAASGPVADAPPNEKGVIPVLEYHLIVPKETNEFTRTPQQLRADLEELYKRGYRPVNMADVLDGKIQSLPRGISPVVLTFDDASPSQFRYIERNGKLEIDPTSAVGILLQFNKEHPDWQNKAVFCLLSGAEAGRSFFGDKGIEGQKSEWRFRKVQFLRDTGFEICNHTLWHARLDKYSDAVVQEQIARLKLAVDSAIPGYDIRTFALPLGMWPKNRPLAWQGSWTNPKTSESVTYKHAVVLEVSGNPNLSPNSSDWNPHSTNRQIMWKNALVSTLNRLDKSGQRYISDGSP